MESDFRQRKTKAVTAGLSLLLSLFLLVLFAFPVPSLAQGTTGNVRGTVVDVSGAVVPDATVTITNVNTGEKRTATTSSKGAFEVTFLPPSTYNVSVSKTGFKTFTQGDVLVESGATFVVSATLEVGTVSQTVEVKAAPVQINKTTMELGGELAGISITNMPNLNLSWIGLQQSLPGVVASSDRFGNNFATDGNRTQANDYTINGMDALDLPLNTPEGTGANPLPPDAIQEVKVIDSSANPQYGRNSGATMNVVVKSGTNQWHGSAYEYYRSTHFNARSFFLPSVAPYHQHQFGATVGGPILHNKLFGFFAYQGVKQLVGGSATTTIFTPGERGGNWSSSVHGLAGTDVSPFPLYGDSASPCPVGGSQCPAGTAYSKLFSTGMIPTQDFNPVSAALMNKYVPSQPNVPGTSLYAFSNNTLLRSDQYVGTLDFHFGPNDTANFLFNLEPLNNSNTLPFTGATLPGFGQFNHENFYRYTLQETHILNPDMVNQFLIGWQRFHYLAVNPTNVVQPSSAGFTGIQPQFPATADLPHIGITGFFTLGFSDNGPQPRIDDTGEISDNFSYTRGTHNFRLGADVRRASVYNPFEFVNSGLFSFGGSGTFTTGMPGVDFLLGIPDLYEQSSGNIINARTWLIYSYLQDEWQVRRNLTLTYGIGWQIDTPTTDLYNHGVAVNAFSPGRQSTVFPTAPLGLLFPGDRGVNSSGGAVTHYNNFGPRFGFAYSPTQKFVFRGGWALEYDSAEEELTLQNLLLPPFSLIDFGAGDVGGSPSFTAPFTSVNSTPLAGAPCVNAGGTGGCTALANKYPFKAPTVGSPVDFSFYEPLSINVTSPSWDVPYVMNFNLTTQYQISQTTITTLSYVGSLGRKLEGVIEGNPYNEQTYLNECDPADAGNFTAQANSSACIRGRTNAPINFPDIGVNAPSNIFASVGTQSTFLTSNYNAFQATVEHAMSHGLYLRGAYTWSHAFDYGSSYENSYGGGGSTIDPFNQSLSYGDSQYDARQRLVLSYMYNIPDWGFHVLPRQLSGGWGFSGIATFQTGFPVALSESDYRSYQCSGAWVYYNCWDHPQTTGTALVNYGNPRNSPNHEWFNPASYTREAFGTIGNAGRNLPFHGPGINDMDFSFWKDISFRERYALRLRADLFDMWNHANFAGPSGNVVSGLFGRITNTTGNARILQISAHFQF